MPAPEESRVSDHHYYGEYAEARHDHREYADARHDHDTDYAEKHHRHFDDERAVDELRRELRVLREALNEYERDPADARSRIRQLEEQTPQARQLELEADLAAADLADSGYDPGPEVDDEGGVSEYRYVLPEDYQRGQS